MLEDGLSYPVRGEWVGRTIIGSVLGFLSFLLIPVVFLMGYFVRVLETTVAGANEPPAFEDWGELFIKGISAILIGLVYSLVPAILYVILVSVLLGTGGALGGDGGVLAGLGFMSMLTFIPLMMFISYIVPAALTNYARTGDISAAFDIGVIKSVAFSVDYLVAMLLPIVVGVVVWVAAFVLAVTIIGLLFVPVLYFYMYVAIFRMFGSAFAKTDPTTQTDSVTAAQST
ncbi:DUF4013 domain-containing protein [Natronolimnobius sp. AArcel1]|uniref:DUF4013 domain-containing protein n=1 Tax=Natronolimnobius sp. AArcel1 TaxID=1679093 RepID=UPI0013EE39D4|nr:DUF4013 domain-containing protein [Natronolimnobius sp. AArcel1]NGM69739.1 DUF4013 domain-containing protein [Natronolimnobius sp. AArcel1]